MLGRAHPQSRPNRTSYRPNWRKEAIKLPLSQIVIDAIRNLPGFGREEYLFPAKPNVRYKENFSKPYMWDIGKRKNL